MWFKNLLIYRFVRPLETPIEKFEEHLSQSSFSPCGSQDISKFGWTPPLGKLGDAFCHIAGDDILLCAKKEEKVIPASAINDEIAKRAEVFEQEHGRPLNKKEKEGLKEDITMQFLPRAFSRHSQTFAWLAPKEGLLVVDASSKKKAEDLLSMLRKSLGSLPVVPVSLKETADITMTQWLLESNVAQGFELGEEVELQSALEHGGIIKAKEQDLLSDEIRQHLESDKMVTQLALTWSDAISFVLTDELALKKVKFSDELQDSNADIDKEDVAARFDADFALMTGELKQLIPELIEALGGETERES